MSDIRTKVCDRCGFREEYKAPFDLREWLDMIYVSMRKSDDDLYKWKKDDYRRKHLCASCRDSLFHWYEGGDSAPIVKQGELIVVRYDDTRKLSTIRMGPAMLCVGGPNIDSALCTTRNLLLKAAGECEQLAAPDNIEKSPKGLPYKNGWFKRIFGDNKE